MTKSIRNSYLQYNDHRLCKDDLFAVTAIHNMGIINKWYHYIQ